MSDEKWSLAARRRSFFRPLVLDNLNRASLESIVSNLIKWYCAARPATRYQAKWRSCKYKNVKNLRVRLRRSSRKNVLEASGKYRKNPKSTVPTLLDRKILAPKPKSRVVPPKTDRARNKRMHDQRTSKSNNWLPIVKVSNRLKPLKRLNRVSVRVVDVLKKKKKKSRVCIRVKFNFGCDEVAVLVSRSLLRTHPNLFRRKSHVPIEDVLLRHRFSPPTQEEFLGYLRLHHVESLTATNHVKPRAKKFLRSSHYTNIPWSSEIGMLLRKPTDVQALVRLERIERFLNNTSTACSSQTYPVSYTRQSQEKCENSHTYRFPSRCQWSKKLSLKMYAHMNIIKPVRVVIPRAEIEAVKQKLLLKLPDIHRS